MVRSTYDSNSDGKVNAADAADAVPWAGVTGKPSTFPPDAHGHAQSDITGLVAALAGKAASSHSHAEGDVTGLTAALAAKAAVASPTFTGTPAAPTAADGNSTTQLATTEFVQAVNRRVLENAQTGTSYTLALSDAGKMVTLSNAGAITLTIPDNATVAFPVNTRIDLAQWGAGQVTISDTALVAASGALRSSGGKKKIAGQYSGATLWKKGTNEWLLIGDIVA
jgi:hypothetical protein